MNSLHLVADAPRSTRNAGVLAVGVASCQVSVRRALQAAVGASVDVETSGAGDTGGPGLLGVLGYQSAGPTCRRHSVQDVGDTDGVKLHHVTDVTTHL